MCKLSEEKLVLKLKELNKKYFLVIRTDCVDFEKEVNYCDNLLEVRAFDENGEFRAYRSVVGVEFACRNTEETTHDGSYTQIHYLDVDSIRSNGGVTYATGAGSYHLPEGINANALEIEFYYDFGEVDGIARVCDWRIKGFTTKEAGR